MLDSTIWDTSKDVRILWVTILLMSDKNGLVEASIPGLAHRSRLTLEETCDAIETLLTPDEYSRSKDHDGRRIVAVDGGWQIINHLKYRDKMSKDDQREKAAERQKRFRDRNVTRNAPSRPVTQSNASNDIQIQIPDPESDPDQKKKEGPAYSASFESFWRVYPRKTAKRAAYKAWQAMDRRTIPPHSIIFAAIEKQKGSEKWKAGYIPNPATWLNGDCWEDEVTPQGRATPSRRPEHTPDGGNGTEAKLKRLAAAIKYGSEIDPREIRDLTALAAADDIPYPPVLLQFLNDLDTSGALELSGRKAEPFWSRPMMVRDLRKWTPDESEEVRDLVDGMVGE
ncbi:MAG: hypothetical protein GY832_47305 [Chloroflexi bacterium]|nr:hypothetical protein [Chloroflexota bacterium]